MEPKAKSPFIKFLLLNERNLFWLFAASALIFIANWFLATHGVVEFESDRLRQLLKAVSAFTPVIGILVLMSEDSKNGTPIVVALVFVSMLLLWPAATLTCFIVLLFCWSKTSRLIGIFVLCLLQLLSGDLFFSGDKNLVTTLELSQLNIPNHALRLRGLTDDGKFCSSVALQEDFPVTKGIRLTKTFVRLKDNNFAYSKEIFSLTPVDTSHVAVIIQHGPVSRRLVVDLATKNRWTEVSDVRD